MGQAFDDSDDSVSSSEEDEDSDLDSDDEEKALMAELAAIKKEKAMQKKKKNGSFNLKRSWTEDTVFKNQGNEPKKKKRFINDTIRSDFHRKFMHRYIK